MKNKQKGFIVPLLLSIITILIIGGGVYIYLSQTSTATINQIASKTLDDYFGQFKSQTIALNKRIIDYKVNKISIVGDFNEKNRCFELHVDYSVKTAIDLIKGNLVQSIWVAGNGEVGTDNWVNNKTEDFSLIKTDNNDYSVTENGTTNMGVCNQPSNPLITSSTTIKQNIPANSSEHVTVFGMQQYTDSNFGFSFWYPNTWTVQSTEIKDNYTGGTVEKTLTIAPQSNSNDAITIDELSSPTREITIPYDLCSPMSGSFVAAHRYYFDVNAHTWMMEVPAYTAQSEKDGSQYSVPASVKAANVSNNTMGGLHMLGSGCSGAVIPLSAKNFVVFSFNSRNVGPYYINIAKTITATDPSVATPVSSDEQIKTITNAGVLLGAIGTKVGEWYVTNEHVYNWVGDIVVGANPSTFKLLNIYSDGTTGAPYATDGVHVYSAWSSKIPEINGADPATFVAIRQQYQIPYAKSSGLYGQSFTDYDTTFAKDKSHVWYESKLIPNADPSTFVVTGDTYVQNSYGGYTLANDAYHIYGTDEKGNLTVNK